MSDKTQEIQSAATTRRCPPQRIRRPKNATPMAAAIGQAGISHSNTVWSVSDTGRRLQRFLRRQGSGFRDLPGGRQPRETLPWLRRRDFFLTGFDDELGIRFSKLVPGREVESSPHSIK